MAGTVSITPTFGNEEESATGAVPLSITPTFGDNPFRAPEEQKPATEAPAATVVENGQNVEDSATATDAQKNSRAGMKRRRNTGPYYDPENVADPFGVLSRRTDGTAVSEQQDGASRVGTVFDSPEVQKESPAKVRVREYLKKIWFSQMEDAEADQLFTSLVTSVKFLGWGKIVANERGMFGEPLGSMTGMEKLKRLRDWANGDGSLINNEQAEWNELVKNNDVAAMDEIVKSKHMDAFSRSDDYNAAANYVNGIMAKDVGVIGKIHQRRQIMAFNDKENFNPLQKIDGEFMEFSKEDVAAYNAKIDELLPQGNANAAKARRDEYGKTLSMKNTIFALENIAGSMSDGSRAFVASTAVSGTFNRTSFDSLPDDEKMKVLALVKIRRGELDKGYNVIPLRGDDGKVIDWNRFVYGVARSISDLPEDVVRTVSDMGTVAATEIGALVKGFSDMEAAREYRRKSYDELSMTHQIRNAMTQEIPDASTFIGRSASGFGDNFGFLLISEVGGAGLKAATRGMAYASRAANIEKAKIMLDAAKASGVAEDIAKAEKVLAAASEGKGAGILLKPFEKIGAKIGQMEGNVGQMEAKLLKDAKDAYHTARKQVELIKSGTVEGDLEQAMAKLRQASAEYGKVAMSRPVAQTEAAVANGQLMNDIVATHQRIADYTKWLKRTGKAVELAGKGAEHALWYLPFYTRRLDRAAANGEPMEQAAHSAFVTMLWSGFWEKQAFTRASKLGIGEVAMSRQSLKTMLDIVGKRIINKTASRRVKEAAAGDVAKIFLERQVTNLAHGLDTAFNVTAQSVADEWGVMLSEIWNEAKHNVDTGFREIEDFETGEKVQIQYGLEDFVKAFTPDRRWIDTCMQVVKDGAYPAIGFAILSGTNARFGHWRQSLGEARYLKGVMGEKAYQNYALKDRGVAKAYDDIVAAAQAAIDFNLQGTIDVATEADMEASLPDSTPAEKAEAKDAKENVVADVEAKMNETLGKVLEIALDETGAVDVETIMEKTGVDQSTAEILASMAQDYRALMVRDDARRFLTDLVEGRYVDGSGIRFNVRNAEYALRQFIRFAPNVENVVDNGDGVISVDVNLGNGRTVNVGLANNEGITNELIESSVNSPALAAHWKKLHPRTPWSVLSIEEKRDFCRRRIEGNNRRVGSFFFTGSDGKKHFVPIDDLVTLTGKTNTRAVSHEVSHTIFRAAEEMGFIDLDAKCAIADAVGIDRTSADATAGTGEMIDGREKQKWEIAVDEAIAEGYSDYTNGRSMPALPRVMTGFDAIDKAGNWIIDTLFGGDQANADDATVLDDLYEAMFRGELESIRDITDPLLRGKPSIKTKREIAQKALKSARDAFDAADEASRPAAKERLREAQKALHAINAQWDAQRRSDYEARVRAEQAARDRFSLVEGAERDRLENEFEGEDGTDYILSYLSKGDPNWENKEWKAYIDTIDWSKCGDYVRTYRAMEVTDDGALIPPMASYVGTGAKDRKVNGAAHVGDIVKSDENPDLRIKGGKDDGKFPLWKLALKKDKKTGRYKVDWSKVAAAYNPYIHSSFRPLNDQFSLAWSRPNLRTVEMLVPTSEFKNEVRYWAEHAKNSIGLHPWTSGNVTRQLTEFNRPARQVLMTKYGKINRVLSNEEVAQKIMEDFGDAADKISIPQEVFPPEVYKLLTEKYGVKGVAMEDAEAKMQAVDELMRGNGSRNSLVTPEQNSAYNEAITEGDDERAVEILRDVASKAIPDTKVVDTDGKPKIVYHHTENRFTEFDLDKSRKSMDIQGFFFFDNPTSGDEYGSLNYGVFLNITNPYVIDSNEKMSALNWDGSKDGEGVRVRNELIAQGYDGVVRTKEFMGDSADEWIAFNPEQIKLAEPTYEDEYGESPVSLDDRFDYSTRDIRYSLTNSEDGHEYTYDYLTSLPDMTVTQVDLEKIKNMPSQQERKQYARESILNAGGRIENGHYIIKMDGEDVDVGGNAITHSWHNVDNEFIYPILGSVLKNAVRVNELEVRSEFSGKGQKDDQVKRKFIYIGVAGLGTEVLPVRIQVDVRNGNRVVSEINTLKSFNAKLGEVASPNNELDLGDQTSLTPSPRISIADLLAIAQPLHPQIFSRDVTGSLGYKYRGNEIGSLYSLILGEKGARRLSNNVSILDNFLSAKNMLFEKSAYVAGEQADAWKKISRDDQLKIKLATGWEIGADGQWKLEVKNPNLKANWIEAIKQGCTLEDVFDPMSELFMMYPDARNIKVESYPIRNAYAQLVGNRIDIDTRTVNADVSGTIESLLHEVQHWVQDHSGFGKGGNEQMFRQKQISDPKMKKIANEYKKSVRRHFVVGSTGERMVWDILDSLVNGSYKSNWHESLYTPVIDSLRNLANKNGYTSSVHLAKAIVDAREQESPYGQYHRLAGEVESRNAERRTYADMVSKLLEDTEDESRDIQIVRRDVTGAMDKVETDSSRMSLRADQEIAIYIPDGHYEDGVKADFIGAILDGWKRGETRPHKNLPKHRWLGIVKNGMVYGRVMLGDPIEITNKSPEYAYAAIDGTEYGLKDGEKKFYYPIEDKMDFRDDPIPLDQNGNYGAYTLPENVAGINRNLYRSGERMSLTSISDAAVAEDDAINVSDETRYSFSTEDMVEDKIRKYASSEEAKRNGWNPEDVENVIGETADLIRAIHASVSGDKNYDEWVKKMPTVRVDWRDGKEKPVVTWSRGNIEYKYDASADLLCINNEGLETVLASPVMADLMIHTAGFASGNKALKKDGENGYTSTDYLTLYETLRDLGFVVPCKGCFDAAMRLKMLPSVSQKFVDLVNKTIDERNKDPEKFDSELRRIGAEAQAKADAKVAGTNKKADVKTTVGGLPVSSSDKESAVRIAVSGDNLTSHVTWTQLMSAEGQTQALADWGGLFRAWQKTGAGRPKDKLMPEPWTGEMVSSTSTIISAFGENTPSFRDLEVNVGTGLRRNSHSEFRPILAVDEIQFMREAYLRRLFVFKYMKELDDVRLFGKLGVKFNMSFFPAFDQNGVAAGLDANGNYIAAEESVGGREFSYVGDDGKTHYDGMKGMQEARKHVNENVSLSSVVFSVPHLIKALTDVPTPKDKEGLWGSLIPFHNSGATEEQLFKQGLGHERAVDSRHPFDLEAYTEYNRGVTNFEQVQNDRIGEGWVCLEGKSVGKDVTNQKIALPALGKHYYNKEKGVHLFSGYYILDSELNGRKITSAAQAKKELADIHHEFSVDYNDKVREIGSDYAYKDAADHYIKFLRDLGLKPRFDFNVPESIFLKMCSEIGVDANHPKLGWKGNGHDWNPCDSDSYYALFCDYGMTDPATGKWSPHRPVGTKDGEFKLPSDAIDIIKDGIKRYSERKSGEDAKFNEAIVEYCKREISQGKMDAATVRDILTKHGLDPMGIGAEAGNFSLMIPPEVSSSMTTEDLLAMAAAGRLARSAGGDAMKATEEGVRADLSRRLKALDPSATDNDVEVLMARAKADAGKAMKGIEGSASKDILAKLSQAQAERYYSSLKSAGRKGIAEGAKATRARERLDRRMASKVAEEIAAQTGIAVNELEASLGVDLAETMLHLQDIFPAATNRNAEGADESDEDSVQPDFDVEESTLTPEEKLARENAIREMCRQIMEKAWKADEELRRKIEERKAKRKAKAKNAEGSEQESEGDESEEPITSEDLAEFIVNKHEIDLRNPHQFAQFIKIMCEEKWKKDHGISADQYIWGDPVALANMRMTASGVYAALARKLMYSNRREGAFRTINEIENAPTIGALLNSMVDVGRTIAQGMVTEKRNDLVKDIERLLEQRFGAKGRFKQNEEDINRKVSGFTELWAREVKRWLWASEQKVADELQNTLTELSGVEAAFMLNNRDPNSSKNYNHNLLKMQVLQEFGGMSHKALGEIVDARGKILDRLANDTVGQEMEERERRTRTIADLIERAVDAGRTVSYDDKHGSSSSKTGKMLSNYFQSHLDFKHLLLDLARYCKSEQDRADYEAFVDDLQHTIQRNWDRAKTEQRNELIKFRKAVEEIYHKSYSEAMSELLSHDERFDRFGTMIERQIIEEQASDIDVMMAKKEGRPDPRKREKIRRVNVRMSRAQAMNLYVAMQQKGYVGNVEKNGREDQSAEIRKLLTPEDLRMIKWIGDWYDQNREALSEASKRIFGLPVEAEEANYFPVTPYRPTQGLNEMSSKAWSPFPPALTARVRHGYDFDVRKDIFSTWSEKMQEQAQWKNMVDLGVELRGIFGRQNVQSAIIDQHGKKAWDNCKAFINDILNGGAQVEGGLEFWDNVRGWTALAALGGNIGVMIKQTTSIPAFAFEIGWANMGRHLSSGLWAISAGAAGNAVGIHSEALAAMRDIWESDQRKNRWDSGNSDEVTNALRLMDSKPALLKTIFQKSMAFNKVGDVVPALLIGQGIYRSYLSQGLSKDEALNRTWEIINRTQQTGQVDNLTAFQRRSAFGRFVTQFQTTVRQYTAYEISAIRKFAAQPNGKNAAELASFTVLNAVCASMYFWGGALWQWILGRRPDEDSIKAWIQSMITSCWGSLFMLGSFAGIVSESLVTGGTRTTATAPSMALAGTVITDIAKIAGMSLADIAAACGYGDADYDLDDFLKAAEHAAKAISSPFRDVDKFIRWRIKGEDPKGGGSRERSRKLKKWKAPL